MKLLGFITIIIKSNKIQEKTPHSILLKKKFVQKSINNNKYNGDKNDTMYKAFSSSKHKLLMFSE